MYKVEGKPQKSSVLDLDLQSQMEIAFLQTIVTKKGYPTTTTDTTISTIVTIGIEVQRFRLLNIFTWDKTFNGLIKAESTTVIGWARNWLYYKCKGLRLKHDLPLPVRELPRLQVGLVSSIILAAMVWALTHVVRPDTPLCYLLYQSAATMVIHQFYLVPSYILNEDL